jgi:opacity protein-like surface antigen
MMLGKMRFLFMTGLLLIISNASVAQGDAWYIAGGLGASFANDSDNTQAGLTVTSELDTGAIGSVAFGRTFGGILAEGELAYIVNDVSALTMAGVGSVPASGDVSATALMGNVYYDFDVDSKWKPYIGGGAGYANFSINNLTSMGIAVADDSAGVFAYQIKAGIGYAFTDSLDGTLGYRFFGTADADLVDAAGFPFKSDGLQTHVVEIGVRYRF